jgi:ATP-dependent protease ClpP protease subunit
VGGGAGGKVQDMEEEIIEMKRLQTIIETHTIKNTKLTKKMLSENKSKKIDWVFNSKEALKNGIVDEII